jgi:hypothetical protein
VPVCLQSQFFDFAHNNHSQQEIPDSQQHSVLIKLACMYTISHL